MLIPSTRRPLSASIDMMVSTHSYRIEFPVFFVPSVFVATCAKMSFISSLASTWMRPNGAVVKRNVKIHASHFNRNVAVENQTYSTLKRMRILVE